jgi:hypothetical protein
MKQNDTSEIVPNTAYIPFTLSEGNSIEERNIKYLSEYRYSERKTLEVLTEKKLVTFQNNS